MEGREASGIAPDDVSHKDLVSLQLGSNETSSSRWKDARHPGYRKLLLEVIVLSGRVYARPPTIDTHNISESMGACTSNATTIFLRRRPSVWIFCAYRWSVVVHRHAPRALSKESHLAPGDAPRHTPGARASADAAVSDDETRRRWLARVRLETTCRTRIWCLLTTKK